MFLRKKCKNKNSVYYAKIAINCDELITDNVVYKNVKLIIEQSQRLINDDFDVHLYIDDCKLYYDNFNPEEYASMPNSQKEKYSIQHLKEFTERKIYH